MLVEKDVQLFQLSMAQKKRVSEVRTQLDGISTYRTEGTSTLYLYAAGRRLPGT